MVPCFNYLGFHMRIQHKHLLYNGNQFATIFLYFPEKNVTSRKTIFSLYWREEDSGLESEVEGVKSESQFT
jgi:hypothetical protein